MDIKVLKKFPANLAMHVVEIIATLNMKIPRWWIFREVKEIQQNHKKTTKTETSEKKKVQKTKN